MLIVLVVWAAMRAAGQSPGPDRPGGRRAMTTSATARRAGAATDDPVAIGQFAPTPKDYESLDLPKDHAAGEGRHQEDHRRRRPVRERRGLGREAAALRSPRRGAAGQAARLGQNKGTAGPGKGDDSARGPGPGGTGADSTRARSLRWVLRFRTSSGAGLPRPAHGDGGGGAGPGPAGQQQADVHLPRPGEPAAGHRGDRGDIAQLASQIQFSDFRRDNGAGRSPRRWGWTTRRRSFWAFFPGSWRTSCPGKEKAYRNRQAEDIEETIFQVIGARRPVRDRGRRAASQAVGERPASADRVRRGSPARADAGRSPSVLSASRSGGCRPPLAAS